MPEISVIVPVYKVEKYLDRCVESILAQTFKDFELILVDDGSPDKCPEMCDEWAKKDNRIIVIHQQNGGLSAARNTGIDWAFGNSNTKWITFVDSDDWIHYQFLEVLYHAVQTHNVLISVCRPRRVDKLETMHNIVHISQKMTSDELYLDYSKRIVNVSAWGKLYHKSCFETIRYPSGKLWEDLATTYRIVMSIPYCAMVNEQLYYYYNNSEGIVRSSWVPKRLGEMEAYEEQIEFFSKEEKWKEIHENLQLRYIEAMSYSYYLEQRSQLSHKEKKYYAKVLRNKMRKALKAYKKKLRFSENISIYEVAYPSLVTLYWRIKGIVGKFK